MAVVLLILMILGYGYAVTRRERVYRQLVAQGDVALAAGDAAAAVAAFGGAIARKPDSMVAYLKRGAAHHRQGDLEAAASDLEVASRLDPISPRAFELRGDVAYAQRQHDEAIDHFTTSVALDDRSPRVLYKLGLAQHVAGRATEAHTALTRAVELDGRFAEAYYLLGLCLRDLNRPRDAEHALKQAVALSPRLTAAREELADLYGAQDRRLARIAELEHLLSADPSAARHVSVAAAYAAAGQTLRAVRLLRRAADLYPDHASVYLELGRVWLAASEGGRDKPALDAAADALQRAAALDASGPVLTALGRVYLAAGNRRDAAVTFQRAAAMLPLDPAVFLHLADLADRSGDTAAAHNARAEYEALSTASRSRAAPR